MITRFYFICVSALLIHKVSLQVTGDIGGSVLLSCSSDEPGQDIEVHWRQNGSKIVYDIIKGKESVEQQETRYKNRVETFPEGYERGNFSIKLNKLQIIDGGRYTCLISHSSEHKTVELIIKEPTAGNGTKLPSTDNVTKLPTEEPKTDGVTPSPLIWVTIVVLLVMIIVCFIIGYRKKIQSALFSPVMTEDKEPRQK
ncbi:CD276 antigen homolog [Carassius auratus]|uniref:CD276 antigen homolog n=1 Tax=Carassius auratus TaxID=7957 RepID=A0A6P6J1M7_CARAU|nr:CD276 antigen homolog [Carassius auratus]